MDLKDFYIYENETIISAIEAIEKNHQRSIFLANDDDKITAVLSQGDIIRAIISGTSMYSHCGNIGNAGFIFLKERNMDKAYKIFKSINLSVIPVIDDDFHLVDVISLSDIYKYLDSKAEV